MSGGVRSAEFWAGESTVVPSTLRGYRTWAVSEAGELASIAMPHLWDREVTAACMADTPVGPLEPGCPCVFCQEQGHDAPGSDCGCGVYGWYAPDDARLVSAPVFGAIEVSGRVVLATHGFRAEKARVVAIAIVPDRMPLSLMPVLGRWETSRGQLHLLAQWCAAHGVPVFTSREELTAAFPPQDVSALVRHECGEGCAAHRRSMPDPGPRIGGFDITAYASVSTLQAASSSYPDVARPARWIRRDVAVWKRRLVIVLAVLGQLSNLGWAAYSGFRLALADSSGGAAAWATATAFFLWAAWYSRSNLRRACRWGR